MKRWVRLRGGLAGVAVLIGLTALLAASLRQTSEDRVMKIALAEINRVAPHPDWKATVVKPGGKESLNGMVYWVVGVHSASSMSRAAVRVSSDGTAMVMVMMGG